MNIAQLLVAFGSMSLLASQANAIQVFEISGFIRQVIPSASGETVPIVAGDLVSGTLVYTPESATVVAGTCMDNAFSYELNIDEVVIQSIDPRGCVGGGIMEFNPFSNVTDPSWLSSELAWAIDIDSVLQESLAPSALLGNWDIFWILNQNFEDIIVFGTITAAREIKVPEPATLGLFGLALMLFGLADRRLRPNS
ncbi:PEP-CTERM sorting domain-containing protein [Peristeroidobacter agariperforans]|uniref:PEP-CTERM sorting domain-containing protein n=1 Tax=Peristeroidobacter agariperforans TaxID=268404 RepID=UPI00101DB11F|nr:PEP-CTERM sorting domain-containing protein [Peristeroidobacter agariperforans]